MLLSRARQATVSRPLRCAPAQLGSRALVRAHAKRKAIGKELRELQQLKEGGAAEPPAAAPAPAAAAPPPPPAPAASASPSSASPPAAAPSSSQSATPLLEQPLVRILGAVIAILSVINIFYTAVFYGASNLVYVFKDQLASITKKDFVPYSERRRLEQEVLAKLEAETAERAASRAASEEAGVLAAPSLTSPAEDATPPSELLNLLPGGGSGGAR